MSRNTGSKIFFKPINCLISKAPLEDIGRRQYDACLDMRLTVAGEDANDPYTKIRYQEADGYEDTLWIKNEALDYNRII